MTMGKNTPSEDVSPIKKNGDFPLSNISFLDNEGYLYSLHKNE